MIGYITARTPTEVARDVERLSKTGCTSFVVRRVSGDAMLNRERLGAARYAAGIQADVGLEGEASSGHSSPGGASVETAGGSAMAVPEACRR
jgi:hypothetical protein